MPSTSPSPSSSSVLTSHLRTPTHDHLTPPPPSSTTSNIRSEGRHDEHHDSSSLLPHHHYSSNHRHHRSVQQAVSSTNVYSLLSTSLTGNPRISRSPNHPKSTGGANGLMTSNVLSRPLSSVHGSAAGRERVAVEASEEFMANLNQGCLPSGWGRRKSYAAKGAPPRSKWDLKDGSGQEGLLSTQPSSLSGGRSPVQISKRPPKSQSSAVLSSLVPQSPPNNSSSASGSGPPYPPNIGSPIREGRSGGPPSQSQRSSNQGQGLDVLPQDIAVIVGSLPASFGTPFRGTVSISHE